jgi:hypothetical protein
MQQLQRPPIAEGELYVGALTDEAGELYHVILLPGEADGINWAAAVAWAKEAGGDLPNRVEQAMLFAYQREQFKKDWYWSNTQHASYSVNAWLQDFSSGFQFNYGKSAEGRDRGGIGAQRLN